jgi:hypothetical protein
MAIDVTEEMRQAVYAADCDVKGHEFQIGDLFQTVPVPAVQRDAVGVPFKKMLGSSDADRLPSISCGRCNKVWLVMDAPAASYADAEAQLAAKLKDPTQAKPTPRQDAAPHSHS